MSAAASPRGGRGGAPGRAAAGLSRPRGGPAVFAGRIGRARETVQDGTTGRTINAVQAGRPAGPQTSTAALPPLLTAQPPRGAAPAPATQPPPTTLPVMPAVPDLAAQGPAAAAPTQGAVIPWQCDTVPSMPAPPSQEEQRR